MMELLINFEFLCVLILLLGGVSMNHDLSKSKTGEKNLFSNERKEKKERLPFDRKKALMAGVVATLFAGADGFTIKQPPRVRNNLKFGIGHDQPKTGQISPLRIPAKGLIGQFSHANIALREHNKSVEEEWYDLTLEIQHAIEKKEKYEHNKDVEEEWLDEFDFISKQYYDPHKMEMKEAKEVLGWFVKENLEGYTKRINDAIEQVNLGNESAAKQIISQVQLDLYKYLSKRVEARAYKPARIIQQIFDRLSPGDERFISLSENVDFIKSFLLKNIERKKPEDVYKKSEIDLFISVNKIIEQEGVREIIEKYFECNQKLYSDAHRFYHRTIPSINDIVYKKSNKK
jgi:hypothetical protein